MLREYFENSSMWILRKYYIENTLGNENYFGILWETLVYTLDLF